MMAENCDGPVAVQVRGTVTDNTCLVLRHGLTKEGMVMAMTNNVLPTKDIIDKNEAVLNV